MKRRLSMILAFIIACALSAAAQAEGKNLLRNGEKYLSALAGADYCLNGDDNGAGAVSAIRDAEEALYSIRTLIPHPPAIVKNLLRPFLAACVMGVFVSGALFGLKALGMSSRIILCGVPIAVGVAVYALAAVKFKVITREDCLLLPKGEKIAKLLKL